MSLRPTLSTTDLGVFFEPRHLELGGRLAGPLLDPLAGAEDASEIARSLGADLGLYRHLVPEALGGAPSAHSDDLTHIDVRAIVLIREALGFVSPLADAIFAVQGLGSYPIALAGTPEQRQKYLGEVMSGARIAAFGLTEPEAGSDVASMQSTARAEGDDYILNGEKTLISNATIANHIIVFASTDRSLGRRGISAFVVEANTPGLSIEPIAMSIAHPIGALHLQGCRIPKSALLGEVGQGFRIAMQTLDAFRISVGGAANGMSRRALAETITHVKSRRQFGAALAEQQMVRAYLAEMATELDAARLLVLRAAHKRDTGSARVSTEAAMAKMYATEAAQRIIDKAVQLHGGRGTVSGTEVERLYREIRPLRIYEGTTEIQKLIVAKGILES